jgi:hypothetical protein
MNHTAILKERPLMPRAAGQSFWRGGKEGTMRRRILPILVAGALMAIGAAPAFGDAGPPGSTFPEQPGWTIGSPSCQALIFVSPGTRPGGVFDEHAADIADDDITSPLLADACLGR